MIHLEETPDPDRIDSDTLPLFSNNSRCPLCRLKRYGGWLRYCPGCPPIRGPHFHHEYPCGGTWDER
jgi:hypothetical protein